MMALMINIYTENLKKQANILRAGDEVSLSGVIYTARDAAHKALCALIDEKKTLPFEIEGSIIYYAGPTPAPAVNPYGLAVGSCGPTTSKRMDIYTPKLLALGLAGMIGKGERSDEVRLAIKVHGAVYFAAVGGAGALYSAAIRRSEVIAFEHLGCESVKRMEIEGFKVFVAADIYGGSIY